jgi:tetratricopeptide (TPR) repeat protein
VAEATVPARFGAWNVIEVAGRGGMGVVYRCRHRDRGEPAAVKTVAVVREASLSGLRAEIHALAQVDHPGVVRVLDAGVQDGLPWYAMEWLEGRTLLDFQRELWDVADDVLTLDRPSDELRTANLGPRRPSPPRVAERPPAEARPAARPLPGNGRLLDVLSVLRRLCEPLAEIHAHGLVHRDLKPANVFLRPDGRPVLVDFGLAAHFAGAVGRERAEVSGVLMGTGWYMAPEQAEGRLVDARADLYALGVVLYELVTGRRPFEGASAAEVITQHLKTPPRPPSDMVESLGAGLDQLILRLLAKKRRDRIGHADDVATLLEELGAAHVPGDEPPPRRGAYLYRPGLEGRREALQGLTRRVDALDREGGCVLVGGESGVGKTALVTAAGVDASVGGHLVVTGEGQAGAPPLHPFAPLLLALADHCLERGPEATSRLLGLRGRMLERYVPALATLPGQQALPAPPELSSEAARARLLDDLAAVIAGFADERPLVLVLDDLQWADELTLDFLSSLPEGWFERHRVLILGTYRSDEAGPRLRALLARPWVEALDLGRLDERAVRAMVADMLALAHPDEALVSFLARHSEGIPFFVAEYLRAAVAEKLLFRRGGRWMVARAAGDDALALPQTLRELVGRRLDGLAAGAARLASAGAVLGREFDSAVAGEAAQLPDAELVAAVSELVTRSVLETTPDGALRFVHDKLREVAYERLGGEARRELHGRAARALEHRLDARALPLRYGDLARHWEIAGHAAPARDYAARAGQEALRAGACRDAHDSLSRALALDGTLAEGRLDEARRARVEHLRGEALYGLGRFEEARAEVTAALRRLGERPPEAGGGLVVSFLGEAARQAAHRTLRVDPLAGGAPPADPPEHVRAWYTLVHVFFHTSELPRYVHATLALLNRAERSAPSAQLAEAYALTALIAGSLPLHGLAEQYWQRALDVADRLDSPSADASVRMITSIYGTGAARWDRVKVATERSAAIAERIGYYRRFEEATALRSLGEYHAGTVEAARKLWAQLLSRVRLPQTKVWALCGLAETSLRRLVPGDVADAIRRLLAADAMLAAERLADSDAIRIRGDLALARLLAGEEEDALREAEAARALMAGHERTTAFWTIEGAYGAADTFLRLAEKRDPGDPRRAELLDGARAVSGRLSGYARVYPVGEPRARLVEGRLALLADQRTAGEKRLREAVRAADRLAMPWDAAATRQALASALPSLSPERARLLAEADQRWSDYTRGATP